MNVSIFGLGYVGCVSLGCLAEHGHSVIGVDVNEKKVDLINQGKPTIIEKDVDHIIANNWKRKRILATSDYQMAVNNTSISLICVGTPSTAEGHLNLTAIFETAAQIGEAIKNKEEFHVIVIRSTVLPGTNREVGELVAQHSGKKRNIDFGVVSNPEFLREGSSVQDYYHPSMTVIGSDSEKARCIAKELYTKIDAPIYEVDIEIAELIKYINNSFHALKIAFANEVGNICKRIGINSHELMQLFCQDTHLNISDKYFKPGQAYGGSCLPKDLKALKTIAHDHYLEIPVLSSIEQSNENQKKLVFDMILQKDLRNIGMLGLSFKEGTDDLRYSPMVELVESLIGKGMSVSIYDKNVNFSKLTGTNKQYIDKHIPHLSELISDDLEKVIAQSDLVVMGHKQPEFRDICVRYPEKYFIDLVKVGNGVCQSNYEGICW